MENILQDTKNDKEEYGVISCEKCGSHTRCKNCILRCKYSWFASSHQTLMNHIKVENTKDLLKYSKEEGIS